MPDATVGASVHRAHGTLPHLCTALAVISELAVTEIGEATSSACASSGLWICLSSSEDEVVFVQDIHFYFKAGI